MPDVLSEEQRRYNMSRIRGRNTKPEMVLRRGLHARGLRFRLYRKDLPGRPDLVFPRYRAVLFVHGCFWHGHGCQMFKWPQTRKAFWREKIRKNQERDRYDVQALMERGWRILTVWECAIRGPGRLGLDDLLDSCVAFFAKQETGRSEIDDCSSWALAPDSGVGQVRGGGSTLPRPAGGRAGRLAVPVDVSLTHDAALPTRPAHHVQRTRNVSASDL